MPSYQLLRKKSIKSCKNRYPWLSGFDRTTFTASRLSKWNRKFWSHVKLTSYISDDFGDKNMWITCNWMFVNISKWVLEITVQLTRSTQMPRMFHCLGTNNQELDYFYFCNMVVYIRMWLVCGESFYCDEINIRDNPLQCHSLYSDTCLSV